MNRHVIIGNGGAGVTAAKAIREISDEDEIVIISREDCHAYSPVLATHYLAGHITYDEMFFVDKEFYWRNNIRTILGKGVVAIDSDARAVHLEDGGSIEYGNLLISTGSKSIVPPIPGVEAQGVFTLWTAEDAKRIDKWVRRGQHAIIVGAGLIGMQTLGAMMHRGVNVTLIEKLDHVMPLVLDAGGAAVVECGLRERGVDLRLGDSVREIADLRGRKVVSLESGNTLEGDLVILATGVRPNIDLAKSCGLQLERGIVVDDFACTSMRDIYAAGDVAQGPDWILGASQVNATWFNAIEQGRVAGLNMAGVATRYVRNVRMNISFPMDIPVASAGLTNRTGEKQQEVLSQSNGQYRKLIFENDQLVGAVLVGNVEEIGILAGLLKHRDRSAYSKMVLTRESAFSCYTKHYFSEARL